VVIEETEAELILHAEAVSRWSFVEKIKRRRRM